MQSCSARIVEYEYAHLEFYRICNLSLETDVVFAPFRKYPQLLELPIQGYLEL